MNGQVGYRWNNPDSPTSIYPVNPPSLDEGDVLLYDEPGRCGGLDSHSHHYRIVKHYSSLMLLVRHGGGDERFRLSGPIAGILAALDSTSRYWILNTIYHAQACASDYARDAEAQRWREAIAEKRIKTRKQRGQIHVSIKS